MVISQSRATQPAQSPRSGQPARTLPTLARFAIRHGQRADDSLQLLLADAVGLAGSRDLLYIIGEPVEPSGRAVPVGETVVAAIRDAYEASDRTDPVAAIAGAVDAANEALYARNRAGAPELRVYLGVTCLVIREQDLVICQVPPTQVVVAQNGAPIALPELASWRADYQPRRREGPQGLGLNAEVAPLLYRAALEPGDLLTLCSSNLAALLDEADLGPLLEDDPIAARELLVALAERRRLDPAYAMVIAPLGPASALPAATLDAPDNDSWQVDVVGAHGYGDHDEPLPSRDGASITWVERGLREVRERARVVPWRWRRATAPRRVVPIREGIEVDAGSAGWRPDGATDGDRRRHYGREGADDLGGPQPPHDDAHGADDADDIDDRHDGPGLPYAFSGRYGDVLTRSIRSAQPTRDAEDGHDDWLDGNGYGGAALAGPAGALATADEEDPDDARGFDYGYDARGAAWTEDIPAAIDGHDAEEEDAPGWRDDEDPDEDEARPGRAGRGGAGIVAGAAALLLLLGSTLPQLRLAGRRVRRGAGAERRRSEDHAGYGNYGSNNDFQGHNGYASYGGYAGRDQERVRAAWPIGSLERHTRRRRGVPRWSLALLAVAAVLVLGVTLVSTVRAQRARAAEARFTAAVAELANRREEAVASQDRAAAYGQLLALREPLDALQIEQAEGFPARQERVAAEREELARALDRVTGIERLGAGQIEVVAPLPSPASAAASRPQLVLGNGQQYLLLDGTLYSVDSRGKALTKLLAKGERVGGAAVGQLLGIAWRIDRLIAFDEARAYVHEGGQGGQGAAWSVLPLAASGLKPVGADTFEGNLYLLTPDRGQIAKFASGAYDTAPQPWSTPKATGDLALAIDLAIDVDIYVLLGDGRVLDFYQGELKAAHAPALVPPLAGASALHTAPGGRFLYLVDPKEGRIVRLGREGALTGVYAAASGAPAFTGAREIAVDETTGVAYLVTDEGVLAVRLPAPQ